MGVFEQAETELGTKSVWDALGDTAAYTVVGGGDSITATTQYGKKAQMNYICTGGGALIRFLTGPAAGSRTVGERAIDAVPALVPAVALQPLNFAALCPRTGRRIFLRSAPGRSSALRRGPCIPIRFML